jgi:hemoglobin/transferrin/lactoferrin receptor protein
LDETPEQINPQGITNYIGTPSWSVLNLSSSYSWKEKTTLRAGIENIFDVHYREFASGISASGRSLMVGVGYEF